MSTANDQELGSREVMKQKKKGCQAVETEDAFPGVEGFPGQGGQPHAPRYSRKIKNQNPII